MSTTTKVKFAHDAGVYINTIPHKYIDEFKKRPSKEILLRQLHAHLFRLGSIPGNVIDLGAWIGDNTLPWAKLTNSTIYAIDPGPGNIDFIQRMCQHNNINNVQTIKAVIGLDGELVGTNDSLGHCAFKVDPSKGSSFHNYFTSVSLDSLYRQGRIEHISCIHLDVEGFEAKVLSGAELVLAHFSPLLTFEQHLLRENYVSLSRWVEERGYKVFLINESLPGCFPDCRNLFAVPLSRVLLVEELNRELGTGALVPLALEPRNAVPSVKRPFGVLGGTYFLCPVRCPHPVHIENNCWIFSVHDLGRTKMVKAEVNWDKKAWKWLGARYILGLVQTDCDKVVTDTYNSHEASLHCATQEQYRILEIGQ